MAMTEEERRKARNEASRRWYAAHKAAKATMAPEKGAKQKPVKKVEAKPAGAAKLAEKAPNQDIQKRIDKLIKKNERVVSASEVLLKEATAILADVYKTGDQKLIDKTTKLFAKKLSIAVEPDVDGRMVAKFNGAKTFRVPKTAATTRVQPAPDTGDEPPSEEESKEISVDPSLLTGVEDGTIARSDIETPSSNYDDEGLDPDEDEDEDEDEKDPDDMDDEEYKRYLERQAEKESDAFFENRAERFRELEEQGEYD